MEVESSQEILLSTSNDLVITPITITITMERMLSFPFVGGAVTVATYTKNNKFYFLYPLCIFLLYVLGKDLKLKEVTQTLILLLSSLGLECKPLINFLLVVAIFVAGNGIPSLFKI